ncbi:hypothetical protein SAMN04487897_106171 [Paenibacillus sp. yr247]|uniref:DUF5107 domain-containing protein n=1 Tax=Paenibacillus sp. yr247 TaxID=1761880 RepID=UPI00088CAA5F|nr:DUF5107 domain-containing protein [Paenibacillus sp. yr247]SDN97224.1 hypothetical protein SAMN04487897_106171 [Paenibacillus sp. yr247]
MVDLLQITEFEETFLEHSLQPCGPIPTIGDPEGVYPYVSYCETAKRPSLRRFKMVSMENRHLKVTVCPDLGGRVHSIVEKASGKEILFQAETVRPARILPRMAFISGGIEVSFPISHTPVQIETVRYFAEQIDDRAYLWCGEREVRCGMQWTVEFSLGIDDCFLTQRTLFHNPTQLEHPWMSWSNAAVAALPDTEIHFPNGRVLQHGDGLREIDWETQEYHTISDFNRMLGFFWMTTDCNAFGAYTPSLGCGLYHIANEVEVPGIKLWVYGIGRHEPWSHVSGLRKQSYLEIQAGPIKEQAIKYILAPGETRMHTEFWFPTKVPMKIRELNLPKPRLLLQKDIPLFEWVERPETEPWIRLMDIYRKLDIDEIGAPPDPIGHVWPPSGMENLDETLNWVISNSNGATREVWQYYLAMWQAAKGQIVEAIEALTGMDADFAHALRGRLLRACVGDVQGACEAFRDIKTHAWSLHPQIVVERDLALSALGKETLVERAMWLGRVDSLDDDYLLERKACLLLDSGQPSAARQLLLSTSFERVHQRYDRSKLWGMIESALGNSSIELPETLGEDDLAEYGLYRSNENPRND